jgi:tripeptide aminopeptidase
MTPSTPGQMIFAQHLRDQLTNLGLSEITLDENGYLMASLPATPGCENVPVVGFIAHLDTSPDASGRHVNPRIVKDYQGGDITLNAEKNIVLSPNDFPELNDYLGQDLIVTDGNTLLGADDKAGIAEIVTAVDYLMKNPGIAHGKIRIAFNPDEEIGQGAHKFDVDRFGAKWAYTMDGGAVGELEFENFNAAVAHVTFNGRNVHPGSAKHKMINSIRIANQFAIMLPRWETPEHTEGYEGFYHLTSIEGTVEKTVLTYIIRDHDRDRFERRKKELEHLTRKINNEFPGVAELEIRDQYYNMREKIDPVIHIVEIAEEAMRRAGITPVVVPIRGGTDGAQLSFKGLPCPNIFAGGLNFHGRYEFVPIPSMEKATATIVEIAKLVAEENK